MRSKLFVPGARPELYAKALASDADAMAIDLEDAVAESRKAVARQLVREFVRSHAARASDKTLIVRVNAFGTPHFEADLWAVAQPRVKVINLPKVESVDDIRFAALQLERAERANEVAEPIGLLINIESPGALRIAHQLGRSHARVVGLQLGLGDLFEPLNMTRRDAAAVHAAMFALRIAAGEAGVYAYDGAFADIDDIDGYRAEAQMARGLGFLGKSCVHPKQIAIANEVFRPTGDEIAHALEIVNAAREAADQGLGVCVVDSKMIDRPFVLRAHGVLATAERLGLLPR